MILFMKDWRRYPTAIVDTKTNNKSFLAMADKYRQMGISNYFFMLALHNPKLQGLDPFNPNLTDEQRDEIAYECKTNPWYFLREVARLPPIAGIEPIRFIANRGNLATIWCFLVHITCCLIQPRQTGKSGSIDVLTSWIIDIASNNTKMIMITKDAALQSDAVARIKSIRELLPGYIYTKSRMDMDNKSGLDNKGLGNEYKTGVARQNEMAANNLGRGLTTAIVHIDEAPFITHIGTTFPAAQAAGTKAVMEAKANNSLYGTVLTTTAGRRDDRDGGYVYSLISNGWVWNETIFDCRDEDDASMMVDKGSTGKIVIANITMSHRQLGYSDKWLFDSIRRTGGSKEKVERDFLNIWNSGSSRSPLPIEIAKNIRESYMEPIITEITDTNYTIRWYVDEDELGYIKKHSKLIMGLDTSEAAGKDAIAMEIIDVATLQVVGGATVGLSNIIEYAKWLARFMIDHPEIILIPERKSTAVSIIDMLLILLPNNGVDPFKRIFNSVVNDSRESNKDEMAYIELNKPFSQRDEFFYTERKSTFGFKTDAARRGLLYGNVLQRATTETSHYVRDKPLIDELLGLTEKNGRIDHTHLGHDDHVISWVLAHWFITHGKNLSHYGIDPGLIMSAMISQEQSNQPVSTQLQGEVQQRYLNEIDDLIEKAAESENETMSALYERRLNYLTQKLKTTGNVKDVSMDGIMDRIRKEKNKKNRLSNYRNANRETDIIEKSIWNSINSNRQLSHPLFESFQ